MITPEEEFELLKLEREKHLATQGEITKSPGIIGESIGRARFGIKSSETQETLTTLKETAKELPAYAVPIAQSIFMPQTKFLQGVSAAAGAGMLGRGISDILQKKPLDETVKDVAATGLTFGGIESVLRGIPIGIDVKRKLIGTPITNWLKERAKPLLQSDQIQKMTYGIAQKAKKLLPEVDSLISGHKATVSFVAKKLRPQVDKNIETIHSALNSSYDDMLKTANGMVEIPIGTVQQDLVPVIQGLRPGVDANIDPVMAQFASSGKFGTIKLPEEITKTTLRQQLKNNLKSLGISTEFLDDIEPLKKAGIDYSSNITSKELHYLKQRLKKRAGDMLSGGDSPLKDIVGVDMMAVGNKYDDMLGNIFGERYKQTNKGYADYLQLLKTAKSDLGTLEGYASGASIRNKVQDAINKSIQETGGISGEAVEGLIDGEMQMLFRTNQFLRNLGMGKQSAFVEQNMKHYMKSMFNIKELTSLRDDIYKMTIGKGASGAEKLAQKPLSSLFNNPELKQIIDDIKTIDSMNLEKLTNPRYAELISLGFVGGTISSFVPDQGLRQGIRLGMLSFILGKYNPDLAYALLRHGQTVRDGMMKAAGTKTAGISGKIAIGMFDYYMSKLANQSVNEKTPPDASNAPLRFDSQGNPK